MEFINLSKHFKISGRYYIRDAKSFQTFLTREFNKPINNVTSFGEFIVERNKLRVIFEHNAIGFHLYSKQSNTGEFQNLDLDTKGFIEQITSILDNQELKIAAIGRIGYAVNVFHNTGDFELDSWINNCNGLWDKVLEIDTTKTNAPRKFVIQLLEGKETELQTAITIGLAKVTNAPKIKMGYSILVDSFVEYSPPETIDNLKIMDIFNRLKENTRNKIDFYINWFAQKID